MILKKNNRLKARASLMQRGVLAFLFVLIIA